MTLPPGSTFSFWNNRGVLLKFSLLVFVLLGFLHFYVVSLFSEYVKKKAVRLISIMCLLHESRQRINSFCDFLRVIRCGGSVNKVEGALTREERD